MEDAARDAMSFDMDDVKLTPADVSIWEDTGEIDASLVPLEIYFVGAPAMVDETAFALKLASTLKECLQEQSRSEFRMHLAQRQKAALRRRRTVSEAGAAEGGDSVEENWREYIHRPVAEPNLKVHSLFDAGNRVRRVLACRLSMAAPAAQQLGMLCFPNIFEPEDAPYAQAKRWHEDPFLICFYSCFCIIICVFLLWVYLLGTAITSR